MQRYVSVGLRSIVLDYAQLSPKKVVTWMKFLHRKERRGEEAAPCSVQNHLGQEKKRTKGCFSSSCFSPLRKGGNASKIALVFYDQILLSHLLPLYLSMFHWIVLNLTSFSLWLKEQKKLSKNKGCFFSVSLLFFRDMSQKSHFLSGYEIYLLYAWKKTESSAWTLIFMERCTETAEARLLWKKKPRKLI